MRKRTFALFSAAVVAAAAMTGCGNSGQTTPTEGTAEEGATKAQEEPQSTEAATEAASVEENKELIVLGGSGAGMAAAIQAVNDGMDPSKILILNGSGELAADVKEKEDFINAAETAEQFEAEIEDTYEIFLADTLKAGNNNNNAEMAEFLTESAEEAKNWLESLGIALTGVEKKDGSSQARSYTLADGGSLADAVSQALVKKVEELKIPVLKNVTVKEIVLNEDGAVSGVKAEVDKKEKTINGIAFVAADENLLPLFSDLKVQLSKDSDGKATGVIVNSVAEVLGEDGIAVPGLYAAGNLINAGVHGDAALAGNDLTATILFGETAGVEGAIYVSDNRND